MRVMTPAPPHPSPNANSLNTIFVECSLKSHLNVYHKIPFKVPLEVPFKVCLEVPLEVPPRGSQAQSPPLI